MWVPSCTLLPKDAETSSGLDVAQVRLASLEQAGVNLVCCGCVVLGDSGLGSEAVG